MLKEQRKTIEVTAAVISKDNLFFATQRGYGPYKDWWEFPGGKVEQGELPEQTIVREVQEELASTISIRKFLCTVEYDYPEFHLTMYCYLCTLEKGNLQLIEHEASRWLSSEELESVKWLPADLLVVEALKNEIGK